jgi:hypothetical protein
MGLAKQRGTREERVALAVERNRSEQLELQEQERVRREEMIEDQRQRRAEREAKLACMPEEERLYLQAKSKHMMRRTALVIGIALISTMNGVSKL